MKKSGKCCDFGESQELIHTEGHCPLCNNEGKEVSDITVEHLVKDEFQSSVGLEDYRICLKENCDIVYYCTESDTYFLKDQVRVPIWFKKDADPKFACYCSEVTEEQVKEAVNQKGAKTVKEVNEITGAMKNCRCIEKNPFGLCCHNRIQEILDGELSQE